MKGQKILFADLDGTLIETYTGKQFPQGIWDMKFKFDVWDKIKEMSPDYLFIVTNQGGIGRFVSEEDFEAKLDYVTAAIKHYIKNNTFLAADAIYCPSIEKDDPLRKPNPGMLEYLYNRYELNKYSKTEMCMIGDASGLPGNFSDSDKKTAENFGIKYIDVNDFLKISFIN